ncbi:phosphoribosylanthranilate isomerase [Halococcus agarilyticus]|uniref:phosphoribosylanthranilate isomerase n=1 Tax=Halococcus agarilyticus TaxID=1232219 RepID=UPI000677ADA8|nr:phosphoribosylanthranilate isomerase [Halococcus agarilyticus]
MTRVKICGLTREADLDAAIDAGADMVGFVCGVPIETPRELAPDRAAALVERVPEGITSVLVTMPETPAEGVELAERVDPDAIQVHDYSPDELAALADRFEGSVLAGVDAADDDLDQYANVADALVLDSTDEQGAGGTGETHDWDRARAVVADLDVPVLLAGGLTPENVTEAVRTVDSFGVDVSSGTERSGGVKDHTAVQQFVERATAPRTVTT